MVELTLPKNSQVKPGKTWPKPEGATNLREYRIYRWSPDDDENPRVIIVGIGRVGRLVADMLDAHQRPYLAIDTDSDMIERAQRQGYRAKFGDATRVDALSRLGLEHAPAVVLTLTRLGAAANFRLTWPALVLTV